MAKFNPTIGDRVNTRKGAGEVVAKEKGWISVQVDGGNIIKARAAQLAPEGKKVRDSNPATTSDEKETVKRRENAGGDIFDKDIRAQYVRTKVGKKVRIDNGDTIAEALRGLEVADVIKVAAEFLEGETAKSLETRYAHLNNGQKRMCIGVRLRKTEGATPAALRKARAKLAA